MIRSMAAAGKNVYDCSQSNTGNTTISLADYDYTKDVVVYDSRYGMHWSDGTAKTGNNTYVQLASEANDGFYRLRLQGTGGDEGAVWFGGTASSYMDASAETVVCLMLGDDNGDVMDTLIGGKAADDIVAGNNDYVYGGAGNDTVSLLQASDGEVTNSLTTNVTIGLSTAGGVDTIEGFTSGLAGDATDTIYLVDGNVTDLKVTYNQDSGAGNMTVSLGAGKLVANLATTDDFITLAVQDATKVWNVAVASTAAMATIQEADGNMADIYVGYNETIVNFNKQSAENDVHLYDLSNSFGGSQQFYNIYAVAASDYGDSLIGSTTMANLLVGGNGDDSLWGYGAMSDTLLGSISADEGNDVFFYGEGDGKDVIARYANEEGKADVIYLLSGSLQGVGRDGGGNMALTLSDSDVLSVQSDVASNDMVYNVVVGGTAYTAKVGLNSTSSTMSYNSAVEFYYGGNKTSALTIADGEDYTIDLGDGHFSNINSLSGKGNGGTDVFFGSGSASETLTGGSGTNSLWGGSGAVSDTLVGAGTTTYGFGKGDGNDVITGSGSDDTVLLYNVSLSDVTSAAVKSGAFVVSLTDGSSLTLKNYTSDSAKTFTLGDGTSWTYSYSTKGWTKA